MGKTLLVVVDGQKVNFDGTEYTVVSGERNGKVVSLKLKNSEGNIREVKFEQNTGEVFKNDCLDALKTVEGVASEVVQVLAQTVSGLAKKLEQFAKDNKVSDLFTKKEEETDTTAEKQEKKEDEKPSEEGSDLMSQAVENLLGLVDELKSLFGNLDEDDDEESSEEKKDEKPSEDKKEKKSSKKEDDVVSNIIGAFSDKLDEIENLFKSDKDDEPSEVIDKITEKLGDAFEMTENVFSIVKEKLKNKNKK